MYFEPSKAAKSRFNIIQKSAPRRTWIKGRTYERQDASRRGSPCGAFNRPFNRGFGPRPKPSISSVDRSEQHPSELQSLMRNSYAVFCLKKKRLTTTTRKNHSIYNS